MIYKPGDRVVVRKDLAAYRRYYMHGDEVFDDVMEGMQLLAGKTVTIREITPSGKYRIKEGIFNWTDGMFEGYAVDDDEIEVDEAAWHEFFSDFVVR